MMYHNQLAVAIKNNGKVLREHGETVFIPFGSEYSIYIKNLNSVRALVSISIDGDDISDGTRFVIEPNSATEIERTIRHGNLYEGNKFKFIERTGNIEEHRGVGIEDGLVRVEYQFERLPVRLPIQPTYNRDFWDPEDTASGHHLRKGFGDDGRSRSRSVANYSGEVQCSTNLGATADFFEADTDDAGITVPGAISEQEFTTVSSFPVCRESYAIVLKLVGETADNRRIRKPVYTKTKQACPTCGRRNKATARFCSECGTSLEIV